MSSIFWHLANSAAARQYNQEKQKPNRFNEAFRKYEADKYKQILDRIITVPKLQKKTVVFPKNKITSFKMPKGVRDVETRDLYENLKRAMHTPHVSNQLSAYDKARIIKKIRKSINKK